VRWHRPDIGLSKSLCFSDIEILRPWREVRQMRSVSRVDPEAAATLAVQVPTEDGMRHQRRDLTWPLSCIGSAAAALSCPTQLETESTRRSTYGVRREPGSALSARSGSAFSPSRRRSAVVGSCQCTAANPHAPADPISGRLPQRIRSTLPGFRRPVFGLGAAQPWHRRRPGPETPATPSTAPSAEQRSTSVRTTEEGAPGEGPLLRTE